MKRIDASFLVIVFLCVQGVAVAQAPPYAYSPPRTSPYLNLLRRGSSPAVNYYGLVRPDVEYRSSIGQLQQQSQANQQAIAGIGMAQGAVLTTGNVAGFMNHGSYFQNAGAGGGGGGGVAGGAGAAGFQSVSGTGGAPRPMGGGGAPRPSGRR